MKKDTEKTLQEFMKNEKPKNLVAAYKSEIFTLYNAGYNQTQIISYLKNIGVNVNKSNLSKLIRAEKEKVNNTLADKTVLASAQMNFIKK